MSTSRVCTLVLFFETVIFGMFVTAVAGGSVSALLVMPHLHFVVIGASLSEPHTSVTALRTRVCMLVCLFGPTTYRKF